jgi:hypothetical protein
MLWPGVPVHAVGVLSPADLAGLIDRVSVPRRNPLFDQMANRDWSSLLHRARIARSIGSPTWTHLFCRGWNNDNHHNHRAQDQSFHDCAALPPENSPTPIRAVPEVTPGLAARKAPHGAKGRRQRPRQPTEASLGARWGWGTGVRARFKLYPLAPIARNCRAFFHVQK